MLPPAERTIDPVALPGREGVFSLTLRDGSIAAIAPSKQSGKVDWLALPGLVNLHAHADRAYTATSFRPRSFADALAATNKARAEFGVHDVHRRARQLFEQSIKHGVTRIRTHTDVDPVVELKSMEGVLAAKRDVADRLDVDVIAFSTSRNDPIEPSAIARLARAIALKPDLLGVSLNSSSDPERALGAMLYLAEQSGLPLDIHLDEHLEPQRMLSRMVADAVIARGLQGRVTLSHLCVLSALEPKAAHELIERIARAEITVVALSETNLFLQDRGEASPLRRGITLVRELLAAGVKVRFGTDNVRDFFYPFGDGDMLDTALFAAVGAHLDDQASLIAGICDGRSGLAEGSPADLVLVRASSFDDALARRPRERIVFKAGRVIAGSAYG